jgi:hypothetical protein
MSFISQFLGVTHFESATLFWSFGGRLSCGHGQGREHECTGAGAGGDGEEVTQTLAAAAAAVEN